MDSREKMYSRDFSADAVVPTLLSRGNGLQQLEDGRRRFSELHDQANLELRKNAFTYHNAILKASTEMQILEKNLLEFKNTLADEKRALNSVMDINENAGNRREHRKSAHFNGSLDGVISRYKADDEKSRSECGIQEIPRWFSEAATDIEDHYEMRRYKESVDLLVAAKKYFTALESPEEIKQSEVFYRLILDAEEGLITNLLEALKAAMDCPFGMDIATCGRLLGHIKFLDKTYDACVSFLDNRTRMLQLTASAMKRDAAMAVFIGQRSQLLFSRLTNTVKEFDEFGFDGAQCRSALIGWIRFHINAFTGEYSDHIFASTNSLLVAAECTGIIRKGTAMLLEVGVETMPIVDTGLEQESIRFVELHISLFVQSSQRILQDGKVQPVTFKTKEAAAFYLETVAKAGLGMAAVFMDGLRLNVAEQFIQFGKVALRLLTDVVSIASPAMASSVKAWTHSVVAAFIAALQTASYRTAQAEVNVATLLGTVEFGQKNLLPRVEEIIKEKFPQITLLFSTEKEALSRLHTLLKSQVLTAPTFV